MNTSERFYLMFKNICIFTLAIIIARYYEYIGNAGRIVYVMTLLMMLVVYLIKTVSDD